MAFIDGIIVPLAAPKLLAAFLRLFAHLALISRATRGYGPG